MLSFVSHNFKTSEPIIGSVICQLSTGQTHYVPSLGEMTLRRAIADLEAQIAFHSCFIDDNHVPQRSFKGCGSMFNS